MNREMLLLAERLVVAVEGMSEDVKSMSAYMYDLSHCVSCILSERKEKESTSLISCDGSAFPAAQQRASTESEYPWQCGQTEGDSVLHSDALQDEEITRRDVSHTLNHSENSHVFSSFTGKIKTEEESENEENVGSCEDHHSFGSRRSSLRPSELLGTREHASVPVTQQFQSAGNSSNSVVYDDVAADVKNEADTGEDWLSLQEDSHAHVTEAAMDDGDSSQHMTTYREGQGSVTKTRMRQSASGLKVHSVQVNSEETDWANGKSLREYMNYCEKPPQGSCRDTAASSSCSEEGLRGQDRAEREDNRETVSTKCRAEESSFRTQEEEKICEREIQSSSARTIPAKASGRQEKTKKSFDCDVCGKSFLRALHLEDHKRTHTGEKPFRCTLCDKTCTSKSSLVGHMVKHSEERPFKCSICGQAFKISSVLRSHMRVHSGEKPFKCSECGKAFTQRIHLTIHMRSHTGERPYKCALCGKAYTRCDTLNGHMLSHSAERPFPCRTCGMRFTALSYLERHCLIEHEVAPPVFENSQ